MLAVYLVAALASPPCPAGSAPQETTAGAVLTRACLTPAGVRNGPLLRRSAGQTVLEVAYRDGQRHGPLQGWFADGQPRAKGAYALGRRVGTWTLWDAAGWRREGPMRGDEPHGDWVVFDPAGQKRAAGAYRQGTRHGAWQWFAGGQVINGQYARGRLVHCDGPCTLLQPQLEIQEAVRGMRAEATACYRAQQAQTPTLQGDVRLSWTITADGSVTQVKVLGGSLPAGPARACLVDAVTRLRVAPPADGAPVTGQREWHFRPKSGFTDTLTTHGPCPTKALRPTLNPARPGLIRCVKKAHRPWPPAQPGAVDFTWRVAADGAVQGLTIHPDDRASLSTCLRPLLHDLRFSGVGACKVEYTLRWE